MPWTEVSLNPDDPDCAMGGAIDEEKEVVFPFFRRKENLLYSIRGFAAGVLLLTVVFVHSRIFIHGISGMEMGGSVEGAPWIVLFTYCISSDQSLLLLPLFVPLAASGNAQTELKSRFCLFLAERSGKKEYLLGKVSGAAISGGLMTVFSYILTLCIVSIACMNITDVSRDVSELPVWNLFF